MNMPVISKGKRGDVKIGLVKEVKVFGVVFSVGREELEIDMSIYELQRIKEILELSPLALLPICMETKTVLFDVEVPEMGLGELDGADEEVQVSEL